MPSLEVRRQPLWTFWSFFNLTCCPESTYTSFSSVCFYSFFLFKQSLSFDLAYEILFNTQFRCRLSKRLFLFPCHTSYVSSVPPGFRLCTCCCCYFIGIVLLFLLYVSSFRISQMYFVSIHCPLPTAPQIIPSYPPIFVYSP